MWALSDAFSLIIILSSTHLYTHSSCSHSTCTLSSHLSISPAFTHPAHLSHSSMPLNPPTFPSSHPHSSSSLSVYTPVTHIYPPTPSTHLSIDLCIQSLMHPSLYWPGPPTSSSLCPCIHSPINLSTHVSPLIHISSYPLTHPSLSHPSTCLHCLSFYLSTPLPIYFSILHSPIHSPSIPSLYSPISPFVYLPVSLPTHPPNHLSLCSSCNPPTHLSTYLQILSIHLSLYPSILLPSKC